MWRLSKTASLNIILSPLLLFGVSFAAVLEPTKNNTAGIDGLHTASLEVANKDNLTIAYKSTRHPEGREGVQGSYAEGGTVNVNYSVNKTKTANATTENASKINENLLVSLLNDTHVSVTSSIHPRKGVGNGAQPSEENKSQDVQQKTDSAVSDVVKTVASIPTVHQENKTVPIKPKKPTVTTGSDDHNMHWSNLKIPLVQPSLKPTTTTTMGTANKAIVKTEEQHEAESTSQLDSPSGAISVEHIGKGYINPLMDNHPGFILPVVITILVVPMFGLLGYLVLRRGREAWKNRHYRRMDFLLDGMYND